MKAFPRGIIVIFGIILLVLMVGGGFFYHAQGQSARSQEYEELQASALLKVDQIVQWRTARLADAAVLEASFLYSQDIAGFLAGSQADLREQMLSRFHSLQDNYFYSDISLVDKAGIVRLSLYGDEGALYADPTSNLALAWQEHKPVLSDLHIDYAGDAPHLDVIAPIYGDDSSTPIGAVILRCEAAQFLYPMIQSWPIPSQSAETLLVRRNGNSVLYLNNLRFQADAALKLGIPLSQTDVPAVMAVLGREGVVEGKDYRGVKVLSYLKAIPNSNWFIVAKIDESEALAEWYSRSLLILGLILGFALVTSLIFGVIWQRNDASHFRKLFEIEAARRKSEASYRTTLISVGDAVLTTDDQGKVELLNKVAETLTGWKLEEARGEPLERVFQIMNEQTRQPVENPVKTVLRDGVVVGLANHTLLIARDGEEYPIADSAAPIQDEKGETSGVVLVFRDQSEERAAAAALKAVSAHQQALLDAIPDIIMEVNEQKVYTWANQVGIDFFGEDVIGKEAAFYFIGEQDTYEYVRPVFNGSDNVFYVESRQRRKDGEERLLAWWCRTLRDASGSVTGALSSALDITERRQAEEEILHQANLVAHAMDAIIGTDLQFVIQSWNGAAENQYGWKASEVIGHPMNEFIQNEYPDLSLTPQEVIDQFFEKGFWKGEVLQNCKDGSKINILSSISMVKNLSGEPVGVVVVNRDITEQKNIKQMLVEEEKLAGIGTLAAGIAHEINTPLQIITGISGTAISRLKDGKEISIDELTRRFDNISSNAWRIAEIVRSLLDYARGNADEAALCAINEIVEKTLFLVEHQLKSWSNIRVATELGVGLPPLICDPKQITQVLINLITNARDAMPRGGAITIRSEFHANSERILLFVSDTGCGIPADIRGKIFDPFFTTKPLGKGTGLGLSIAAGIIRAHGGEIEIQSTTGEGTCFKICLPLQMLEITDNQGDKPGRF